MIEKITIQDNYFIIRQIFPDRKIACHQLINRETEEIFVDLETLEFGSIKDLKYAEEHQEKMKDFLDIHPSLSKRLDELKTGEKIEVSSAAFIERENEDTFKFNIVFVDEERVVAKFAKQDNIAAITYNNPYFKELFGDTWKYRIYLLLSNALGGE